MRVIACLTGRPFMIHSDIEGYGLRGSEWQQLRKALRASKTDTIVLVWGPERDVDTAVREAFIRAQDALAGVPAETRQAGPTARPVSNASCRVQTACIPTPTLHPCRFRRRGWNRSVPVAPRRPWEREDALLALGLDRTAAQRLVASPWIGLFERLDVPAGDTARLAERAMQHRLPRLVREDGVEALPTADRLQPWVDAIGAGDLTASTVENALERILAETSRPAEAVLERMRPHPGDQRALDQLVKDVAREVPSLRRRDEPDAVLRWAMGRIMPTMLGHVDPRTIRDRLETELDSTIRSGSVE